MPQGTNEIDLHNARRRHNAQLSVGPAEQLPPNSPQAEKAVLGCCLLDPATAIPSAIQQLKSNDAFYLIPHQIIFEHLIQMHQAHIHIDLVTLQQHLRDTNELAGVGGLEYLAGLPDNAPTASMLDHYASIVIEKYRLRCIMRICEAGLAGASANHSSEEIVNNINTQLNGVVCNSVTSREVRSSDCAARFTDDLQVRFDRQGAPSGVLTGLCDYDRITGGLQFGEQCIVGARPSVGKTALGLSILNHACLVNSIPSLFISFEMSLEALMRRLCAIHMRIGMQALRSGQLNEEDRPKLPRFVSICRNRPLTVIDYCSGAGANTVVAAIEKAAQEGVKLVIIDYLTKISSPIRHEKKTYEVAATSGLLRSCAVSNKVALVTLAQLNRDCDKGNFKSNKPRLPRMSDLSDSGQVERDADVVALLHREKDSNSAVLNIAKNRDGECGLCHLHFRGIYCKFENGLPPQPEI